MTPTAAAEPLRFYRTRGPYGALSNFYPAPMTIGGRAYPTVEHYFQACKASTDRDHERIRRAGGPLQAKRLGRALGWPPGWRQRRDAVMLAALRAKFTQHPPLAALLVSTAPRPLAEDSPTDRYWGCRGANRLGQLLEQVRAELIAESGPTSRP